MNSTEVNAPESLASLRMEQARILKQRAFASCLIVEFVIAYTAAIILISGTLNQALLWFGAGTAMVIVTFIYSKINAPAGIDEHSFSSYLKGHIIVSCLTGMVWSGFAIYQINLESEYTVFVACLIVCSITMGGVLPSSAYRPGYIGLSVFAILPLGIYLLLYAPGGLRLVGLGMLVYFLFAMYISAHVEIETRETIASRNARALNEKVIAQNQIIQKASEEKTRFLAATSHDLSQPVHAQGFFIQALRSKLDEPDQIDLLKKIEESWRAQRQLLQAIVDISRFDSGAIIPQKMVFELGSEAHKLADEFAVGRAEKLVFNTDFDEVLVQTDPALLNRIIRNLLSNAQKFTPDDGRVDFSVKQINETAVIEIKNSSPPISEADKDRIFDEYIKLSNSNNQDGLGLGLSIVRRLTQLLDIRLELHSSADEGTSFVLELPVAATPIAAPSEAVEKAKGFPDMPLIVLVDDEKAVRQSMAAVFSSWNCQLITGANSAEALDIISRTHKNPSLLIVDKRLGKDDNGLDLIQAIREEVNEETPAILISGDISDLEDTKLIPGVQLMNKPIEPDEIWRVMTELLSK